MKVLKGYVHSMAPPKVSMVDCYVVVETFRFVTKYLHEFEHVSKEFGMQWKRKE